MTLAFNDSHFPTLLAHTVRKDWGVGLLAGETDGKRRYLFEDGEERTFASGFHQMMCKVEKPSPAQQAAHVRLRSVLAARARAAGATSTGWSLLEQLTRFHAAYPAGLSDPKWAAEVRGEGAKAPAPRHRDAMVRQAQELLSLKALDALLTGQHFGQVWDRVLTVLGSTDLVPAAQRKQREPTGEPLRNLAIAVRELLHGNAAYGLRFERYLAAVAAAFDEHPRWEVATALSALVHPAEHVCVDLAAFRKQIRADSSRRTVSAQPSSAGYASCLSIARLVANKLADHGEAPRDLLDVRDFIAFTLRPAPRSAGSSSKKPKPSKKHHATEDGDDD
jgi:hypothetical protein